MRNSLLIISLLLITSFTASAQGFKVRGRVSDASDKSAITGAAVFIYKTTDTVNKKIAITDSVGRFSFPNVEAGNYFVKVSFFAYKTLYIKVPVTDKDISLGNIKLSSVEMTEVKVEGHQVRAEQKGDTVSYNADAFKTNPDANAEDLITKMPGIVVQNGSVQAHGEDVKQVLVDGKPYFGDDPTAALRNLPAEVIDKVEVYDKMSDQSQFTGFDDGNSQKTINIVTKKNRQNGQFGRGVLGYGTDDRYQASGTYNIFNGNQRISLVGLSNNINQQNFTSQDLLGISGSGSQRGMGGGGRMGAARGGGGPGGFGQQNNAASNFLVGQQGGINTTNSAGINYSDSLGKKIYFTGSYFFNNGQNSTKSSLARKYVTNDSVNPLYNEGDTALTTSYNHRVNLRFEYNMDSANSFVFTPKFSYQSSNISSTMSGVNRLSALDTASTTQNNYGLNSNGYDLNANLLWRHKFARRGRTLSWNIGTDISNKTANDSLQSVNKYYGLHPLTTDIDQQSASPSSGRSFNSSLIYTEPVSRNAILVLSYNPSYTRNMLDKRTYTRDNNGDFNVLDTALSNSYTVTTLSQNAGLGFRMRFGPAASLAAGVSYQHTELNGQEMFPNSVSIARPFDNVLPNLMFTEKFKDKSSLRIFYRTSTNLPGISQLQSVINNTNPLLLSTGNPDLLQSYAHNLIIRYGKTNTDKAHSFFIFGNVSTSMDYIGNSTVIALKDSILPGGFRLAKGSQLTRPVNLNNQWSARTFATYGLPLDFMKSNLNLNAGVQYSSLPGLVNNVLNYANTYAMNPGVVLSSNISEKVDFTLSYNSSYNIVDNSINTSANTHYFTHTAELKFNWIFWQGFTFNTDISHVLYTGLTSEYNQSLLLVNGGIGKKLFKDQNGELRLMVFDLLNQNTSISRTVTDTYTDDLRTQVLQRYFMLTFTYNLKHFTSGS